MPDRSVQPYCLHLAHRAVREGHGEDMLNWPERDRLRVEVLALAMEREGEVAITDAVHDLAREIIRGRRP